MEGGTKAASTAASSTVPETGRFGDLASVCRSIVEAIVICYIVVWLVALLAYAVGALNIALFLVNLLTLVVALFSIIAINGIHETYLTRIFVAMGAIAFAISGAFAIFTGISAISCAAGGTLCPAPPDTYTTYAVAAVMSLFLAVLSMVLIMAANKLLDIYEDDDRENKIRRSKRN